MLLSNEHTGLGHKKKGGRKRGVRNKLTADLKAMILAALNQAGGTEYLLTQAESNPAAFMTLLGKILPLQVVSNVSPISYLSEQELRTMRHDLAARRIHVSASEPPRASSTH